MSAMATKKKRKKKALSPASMKEAAKKFKKELAAEVQDELDAEAWESGKLGRDERYVARADAETERLVDEALGLKPINIRLPPQLIEDLKAIAAEEGFGYQPYVRMLLTRHIRKVKKAAG